MSIKGFRDRLDIPYRPQSHQCSRVIVLIARAYFEDYFFTLPVLFLGA